MPQHTTNSDDISDIVKEEQGDLFEAPENAVLIRELCLSTQALILPTRDEPVHVPTHHCNLEADAIWSQMHVIAWAHGARALQRVSRHE